MHFYNKVVGTLLRQNSSFGKTEKYIENPTWCISIRVGRAPPMPHVFQLALSGFLGSLELNTKAVLTGEFPHFQCGRKKELPSFSADVSVVTCHVPQDSFRFPGGSYQRASEREHGLKGRSVMPQRLSVNPT